MKKILLFAAAFSLMQSARAATAVPDAISYQGRALTSAGALIGATTPVNRTVTFRIWNHATNQLLENLVYSEQQVVTIADGEFSVLVGQGSPTSGTPLGFAETTKGPGATIPLKVGAVSIFEGASRYLGVTIDDGTAAVDNEISPRQQFVSSSYAMRAKVAESVDSLAISTAMLQANAVTTAQISDAAITTAKLATNAVTTSQVVDSAVTLAKLAAEVKETLCPPGSVMAFMGTTAPAGWLLCNGASVNRVGTYASLFAAIGTSCGTASSTVFNIPDLRGRFLRGWNASATGAGRDPDAATAGSRITMAWGGNSGDAIGSLQFDIFKAHTHLSYYPTTGYSASYNGSAESLSASRNNATTSRISEATGGLETRPVNVSVNYIIKY